MRGGGLVEWRETRREGGAYASAERVEVMNVMMVIESRLLFTEYGRSHSYVSHKYQIWAYTMKEFPGKHTATKLLHYAVVVVIIV